MTAERLDTERPDVQRSDTERSDAERPEIRLFTFPGSNAALTAELILAHAGVPHERVQLRPGLHAMSLKARGFPKMTVPALELNGHKLNGSRSIARLVADELAPSAGLLPSDPARRERVLEAERQGERLQNAVRRMFYASAVQSPVGVRNLVDANYGGLPAPVRGLVARALAPTARLAHRVRAERGPEYVAQVVALLALADELADEGTICTDAPNVADFQFAPNVVALGEMPGRLGDYARERRVYEPMRALLPAYPVSFGIAPPDAWIDDLDTP